MIAPPMASMSNMMMFSYDESGGLLDSLVVVYDNVL